MKKLPVFPKTPWGVVISLSLIVLVAESLLMVLIGFQDAHLKDGLPETAWMLIDAIVLTAIVSIALHALVL